MEDLNVFLVFGAGVLSFLSPCSLPLYPAFLSYITGMSIDELEQKGMIKKKAIIHTLFFLIGFSMIFFAIAWSTSFLGNIFMTYKSLIRQIGAIVIAFFGFVILGWITPSALMKEKKWQFKVRPSGYIGSILIGMGFAAGWTPCTGPILAAVLALSATAPEKSFLYMGSYVLGFAVPFFLLSFFLSKWKWLKKYSAPLMKIGGVLMIVMGIVLYFNWMTRLTSWLVNVFGGFTGF